MRIWVNNDAKHLNGTKNRPVIETVFNAKYYFLLILRKNMIQAHLHVVYPSKGKINSHRKQFRILKLVK